MEHTNDDELYPCSDLSLVAALIIYGAKIVTVERNRGPRATFYLRAEKGLEALAEAFYAHTLQVEPLAYFNALKEAKTRLYGPPITYGD